MQVLYVENKVAAHLVWEFGQGLYSADSGHPFFELERAVWITGICLLLCYDHNHNIKWLRTLVFWRLGYTLEVLLLWTSYRHLR
jgi:hypothetical protein